MTMIRRTAFIAALLTVFTLTFLALPASVSAEDYCNVHSWRELQEAIDNSDEGDLINVVEELTPEPDDSYIHIPSGKKVTIDLCGHTIDRGLREGQRGGQVFLVEGDLTIFGGRGNNSGTITGGYNYGNGSSTLDNAGGITVKGGRLTLESGIITGNHTSGNGISGGGVYLASGAEFYMNGGVISGNEADDYNDGGGVGVGNGTFVMTGGTIEANKAADGGGVYVGYGRFEMKGGTIRRNNATIAGGGVYAAHYNNHETFGFYLSGGSITENQAAGSAGGVYVSTNAEDTYPCPFYLSGSPIIKDNLRRSDSSSEKSNLVLVSAVPFTLTEKLDEEAKIGVTRIVWDYDQRENPEVFAKGLREYGSAENFKSDTDGYIPGITADGDGALCQAVQVDFDAGDDRVTGSTPSMTVPSRGEFKLPENGFDDCDELMFLGWLVGDPAEVKLPGDTVIVSGATTIKAKWYERENISDVEVELSEDSFTYNGAVQKPDVKVTYVEELTEGTDYEIVWPDPDPVNAGEYTVSVRGKGYYTGTATAGYEINGAPLTLKSADLSKEYDGDPLTNADAADVGVTVNENGLLVEEGWIEGEGASYTFTGSSTLPGEQNPNSFTITANEGTLLDNYIITKAEGSLSITDRTEPYEITVTANSATYAYNGREQQISGFIGETEVRGIPVTVGDKTYYVGGMTSAASATNVKDSVESIPVTGTAKVKDVNRNDVTAQFSVNIIKGSLTITPAPLTLVSATLSREYDGTPLTNAEAASLGVRVNENGLSREEGWKESDGATYTFLGSALLPGDRKANAFTVVPNIGTDIENYAISQTEGTLSIRDRTEKFYVGVTANSARYVYNGEEQEVSGFIREDADKGTPVTANGKTFYVSGLTSYASVKNVSDSIESIPITGTEVVKDEDGNDVTSQFIVIKTSGYITITPAELTLASADLTREYNGAALTNSEAASLGVPVNEHGLLTEDGWKGSDGASYEFTGSALLPDEQAANAFTVTPDDGTVLENYNIAKTEGTLSITARTEKLYLTLQGKSYTGVYDGKEHKVSGFIGDAEGDAEGAAESGAESGADGGADSGADHKGTPVALNGSTLYVTGFSSEASGTHVSDSVASIPIKVTGVFHVEDENGNDVTSQFSASLVSGSFTIKKASYKMTIKGRKPSAKYAKLKKKSQKIKRAKAITVKGTIGKVTYKKTGGTGKIKVNKKNGDLTIKKGLKKGRYKVRVKVTSPGDADHSKQSQTVTVTVSVK